MSAQTKAPRDDVPGLAARRIAAAAVDAVLRRRRPLDDTLDADARLAGLPARDRAFVLALALTTMRRLGQLLVAIEDRLDRGMPRTSGALEAILATGAAQILFLDVPDHAAVDIAVRLVREDPEAIRYSGLANAVLRAIARERTLPAGPEANLPEWLGERWAATYGGETTLAMAEALLREPPLDLTPKTPSKRAAADLAERLGGVVLPTGTVRLAEHHGPIPALSGFAEREWFVQDAGALLPVLVAGEVKRRTVLDLCAAPGGKTAALAARGAAVTAVDHSVERLARLAANLDRLRLEAETVVADVASLDLGRTFDVVLLDAPCTATGTLRRHPDVAWTKRLSDVAALVPLQRRLIDAAVRHVRPGGHLIYVTCSLEPEEGEAQIAEALSRHGDFALAPVAAREIGGLAELVAPDGALRTRPDMLAPQGGIDGFYVARLARREA